MSPHKLLCRAKALVPQSHGCVDDVFTITTHHHEPGTGERHLSDICVQVNRQQQEGKLSVKVKAAMSKVITANTDRAGALYIPQISWNCISFLHHAPSGLD